MAETKKGQPGRYLEPGQRAQLFVGSIAEPGTRLVYETTAGVMEAPNWTPDGKWLVVNTDGLLYRIAAEGGSEPELIDTGHIDDANNDHVLSWDGKTIYITSRDGHLYEVPFEGGTPRRISNDHGDHPFRYFLHGVSPDGKTLAYTAMEPYGDDPRGYRNIYTIPVAGGPDVRLTDTPYPADGSEYTPDGEWIYFNSELGATVPGHAQIFRMRPDGSEVTKLTDDERVNWFPHLSPNGEHVLYISYEPGIEGHPANKDVIIRLMDPLGGNKRDVVSLFGGQGTINVNSWAPDNEHFAFVAYPID